MHFFILFIQGLESPRLDSLSTPSTNSTTVANDSSSTNAVSSSNIISNADAAFDNLVFDSSRASSSAAAFNSSSNVFQCNELPSLSDSLSPSCLAEDKGSKGTASGNGLLIDGGDHSTLHQLLAPSAFPSYSHFGALDTGSSVASSANNLLNKNSNVVAQQTSVQQQQASSSISQRSNSQQPPQQSQQSQLMQIHQNAATFSSLRSSATAVTSSLHIAPSNFMSQQSIKGLSNTKVSNTSKTQCAAISTSNFNNISSSFTNLASFNQSTPSSHTAMSNINSIPGLPAGVQLINSQGQLIPAVSSNIANPQQILSTSGANSQLLTNASLVQNGQLIQGAQIIQPAGASTQMLAPSLLGGTANFVTPNSTVVAQQQPQALSIANNNSLQLQTLGTSAAKISSRVSTQLTSQSYPSASAAAKSPSHSLKSPVQQHSSATLATQGAAPAGVMFQQLPMVGGGNVVIGNAAQQQNAIKPMMTATGQLIQLLSNNSKIPSVVSTPKLIQPKQPQLLPKPIVCAAAVPTTSQLSVCTKTLSSSGLPPQCSVATTPPCSTALSTAPPQTLMAIAGTNQSVLGAAAPNAAAPTVITSNGTASAAAGSLFLNGSLLQGSLQGLQSGLQHPVVVQHPSGVHFLLKPANTAPNPFILSSAPQFLVNTPTAQPAPAANKASAPAQAIMIPGTNGQAPTFVVPQGLAQSLAVSAQSLAQPSNIVGANTRTIAPTQGPIYRILPPQQPPALHIQQINTPNGPSYIAVPSNAAATLNLPAGTVLGGPTVRPLAPPQLQTPTIQIAPSTLQIAAPPTVSLAPTVLGGNSLALGSSAPSLVASMAPKVCVDSSCGSVYSSANNLVVSQSTLTATTPVFATQYQQQRQHQNNIQQQQQEQKKKKAKKKKKEPKENNKRNSINLNDILKETGILGDSYSEDHDINSLIVEDDAQLHSAAASSLPGCSSLGDPTSLTNISCDNNSRINTGDNCSSLSMPAVSFTVMPSLSSSNVVLNSNVTFSSSAMPSLITSSSPSLSTLLSLPTSISSSANNHILQPNILNIAGTGNPLGTSQLLGNKMTAAPTVAASSFPQGGVVATFDAQGKLILGSLASLRPQLMHPATTSASILPSPANGLVMSWPLQEETQSVLPSNGQVSLVSNGQPSTAVMLSSSVSHQPQSFIVTTAAQALHSTVNVSSSISPTKAGAKKIGTELSKVVQNTQLFKALQPDNSNTKVNVASNPQDGSVIIGVQSFKPTSTGYGVNKMVPVNSISNSSNSFNMIVSSSCSSFPTAASTVNTTSATFSPVSSVASQQQIKISVPLDSSGSYNNVKNQPSFQLTESSSPAKSRRNSRSKKKRTLDEDVGLMPPSSSGYSQSIVVQCNQDISPSGVRKENPSLPSASAPKPAVSYLSNGFSISLANTNSTTPSIKSPSKGASAALGASSISNGPPTPSTTPVFNVTPAAPTTHRNVKQVLLSPTNKEVCFSFLTESL